MITLHHTSVDFLGDTWFHSDYMEQGKSLAPIWFVVLILIGKHGVILIMTWLFSIMEKCESLLQLVPSSVIKECEDGSVCMTCLPTYDLIDGICNDNSNGANILMEYSKL